MSKVKTKTIVDQIVKYAAESGIKPNSVDIQSSKRIVLSVVLFQNENRICEIDYCDSITKKLSHAFKQCSTNKLFLLHTFINYYETVLKGPKSFYDLIFLRCLSDLKEKCNYDNNRFSYKTFEKNEANKILLVQKRLWEIAGFSPKSSDDFTTQVFSDFETQYTASTDLEKEKQQFITEFNIKFASREKLSDLNIFERLSKLFPDVVVTEDIKAFLNVKSSIDFNKKSLSEYIILKDSSIEVFNSFINKFNESYDLTPSTTDVAIILQILELLNYAETKQAEKERAAAAEKERAAAVEKERAAAAEKERAAAVAAAAEKERAEQERVVADEKKRTIEGAIINKSELHFASKEEPNIRNALQNAVSKGFLKTTIDLENDSLEIVLNSKLENQLMAFLEKIPGDSGKLNITKNNLIEGVDHISKKLKQFTGINNPAIADFVNKIKENFSDSDKLANASTLQRIKDENFKNYWLEISKDSLEDDKIVELFKPEYYDIKNYVLAQFYDIADKSRRDQLNDTFDSFVFLCDMLEFMHANPQSGKKYIDIYKNLKIFETQTKITETDKNNVKSVFFKYLRLSLMNGIPEKEKDLINQMHN